MFKSSRLESQVKRDRLQNNQFKILSFAEAAFKIIAYSSFIIAIAFSIFMKTKGFASWPLVVAYMASGFVSWLIFISVAEIIRAVLYLIENKG